MGLTGTVTADSTTLTSPAVNGQVVTFTGQFTDSSFTGTTSDQTADVAQATREASSGPPFTSLTLMVGTAHSLAPLKRCSTQTASSAQKCCSASSTGKALELMELPHLIRPASVGRPSAPGSFPSDSFILGTLVSFEIKTDNGTITFVGTTDTNPVTGVIRGAYSVSGGSCDQTGTAVLVLAGQWDYRGLRFAQNDNAKQTTAKTQNRQRQRREADPSASRSRMTIPALFRYLGSYVVRRTVCQLPQAGSYLANFCPPSIGPTRSEMRRTSNGKGEKQILRFRLQGIDNILGW